MTSILPKPSAHMSPTWMVTFRMQEPSTDERPVNWTTESIRVAGPEDMQAALAAALANRRSMLPPYEVQVEKQTSTLVIEAK